MHALSLLSRMMTARPQRTRRLSLIQPRPMMTPALPPTAQLPRLVRSQTCRHQQLCPPTPSKSPPFLSLHPSRSHKASLAGSMLIRRLFPLSPPLAPRPPVRAEPILNLSNFTRFLAVGVSEIRSMSPPPHPTPSSSTRASFRRPWGTSPQFTIHRPVNPFASVAGTLTKFTWT